MVHSSKRKQSGARTDVLIIGGGPGGSAAAIHCASAGLEVTLIEGESFPRERQGETLHPGVEPLLKQLGVFEQVVRAGFLRHEGNWVTWNSPARFEPFGADEHGPWLGYQAWRADFDLILLDRARQLGVRVMQPCRAGAPLLDNTRVTGVETAEESVSSTFVIDAAGGSHWLARHLSLPVERWSPPLIARFRYFEGDCPARDEAPAIVADENGWTWTAQVKKNIYQWTRLAFQKEAGQATAHEFERLKPLDRVHGADVTWRLVARPAGPGYFLAGDAAALLDPASSHGALKAMMSGIMAAHLIAQVMVHNAPAARVAAAYCHWMQDWFFHDVRAMLELYAQLPCPPDWLPETLRSLNRSAFPARIQRSESEQTANTGAQVSIYRA
jgi:flavin-dependent dehydrogenase